MNSRQHIPGPHGAIPPAQSAGRVPAWVRIGALALAGACIAIGEPWRAWHPLELAMDVLAPCMLAALALARTWNDGFVRLSLLACGLLACACLASWRWLTLNA